MPKALSFAYRVLVFGDMRSWFGFLGCDRVLVFWELRYAFGIKLRLSWFGFVGKCDMPPALSSAYRIWVLWECAIALLQRLFRYW